MSREKVVLKVAGTKYCDVVEVQKSRVDNVANVANHSFIFLHFVSILIKSLDDFFNKEWKSHE